MAERERINWEVVLREWLGSGLSQKKYCEKNGLSYSTFNYHRRKELDRNEPVKEFVELKLPSAPEEKSILKIEIDRDFHLRVCIKCSINFEEVFRLV